MDMGRESKGMGMNERQDNAASEREEIAARIASFKATQEKFKREREEYFVTTLQNARARKARATASNVRRSGPDATFWHAGL